MLILSLLMSVGAYYLPPTRHAFIISARTLPPYRLDSFPFTQVGPYKTSGDPIIFARPSRVDKETSTEGNEKSVSGEKKEESKKGLSNIIFGSTVCRFFFYTAMAVIIFFIGYQTRKSHEGGSYVRLPTTSNN
ncbi:uncharacterized protein Eint_031420 [Encephalitozoon intestinalis ATCC 50506]|uniref:Uncharacterized protein n=1 Tax=Encephalitozoon intestinalis (strain ATCC 50506) TaxID=876142 RepID=E0S6E9_ENCIT|nr:uncharacterized protein Eint_031420 [Encephalitozoon intestinalis ATCC 50506]ADM11284.1 hypothetical protein Eint_031420 [Encephalitozoon intestinalis ATCC 50506]UTX44952.1 hypothetical protein GPK93_03g04810 [Encephalitozoon intestinalis]